MILAGAHLVPPIPAHPKLETRHVIFYENGIVAVEAVLEWSSPRLRRRRAERGSR